jgi:ribonuclease R
MTATREGVIGLLRDEATRPLSFKEMTRKLGVEKLERERFKRLLGEMATEGAIVKIRGNRFGLPSRMNLVTGTLGCHADGYGFVTPEEGGSDVYINRRRMKDAMHGDRVVCRVEGHNSGYRGRDRREGAIIRVLERAHARIVGRFSRSSGFSVVIPSDERIRHNVVIPPKMASSARDGQIVEAEIIRWPAGNAAPAGRVVDILGDPEDPDVEIEIIVRKHGLSQTFPADVINEAELVPLEVTEDEREGRVDLGKKPFITIDGETAKDFDDAVHVERKGSGYRLYVSIADVSHYVKEGTALDREAYGRATSVYFPDRAIPMLPERLSNVICSLNPKVDRLTMTAEIDFDADGRPIKKHLYESVIKSVERMTYTKVSAILSGDADLNAEYAHIAPGLAVMEELAKKLVARRFEGGSIDFDLPEPQIILDIEGKVEDIVRSERNIAHRIIEEFMLAANRAVAEKFSSAEIPFIYRVHERPDAESIRDFRDFVAGFGYSLGKADVEHAPLAFQRVLEAAKGKPEEKLINTVLLRSMRQAVYSEKNAGHFGLAFDDYTHFTSPIRRYPDLIVHRLVRKLVSGAYSRDAQARATKYLPGAAAHSSVMERKAMEAEREIVDLKKAQFMLDRVGEEFDGFVSGVTSFGIFVELKEFFIEGLVHVTSLDDDYYVHDEKRHRLIGENTRRTFSIGDEARVEVENVSMELRRISFILASPRKPAPRPATRPGRPGRKPHAGRRGRR